MLQVPLSCPYPPPPRPAAGSFGMAAGGTGTRRWVGLTAAVLGVLAFAAAPVAVAAAALACLFGESLPAVLRAGGFIVLTPVAFVYLKSLLPRRIPPPAAALPVEPADQPMAFAFLARVAEDIGAPPPTRLLLGSEVELRLGGRRSVLDLVRPAPVELHIGLWLWHGLTLSEFQAVAARTLAPLAGSRADRLSSRARGLLAALVAGYDRVDELADEPTTPGAVALAVRATHRALTFPLRLLGGLLLGLGRSDADVFRDDRAAVGVAGSDGLVHAVLRADLAGAALRQADEALAQAARDGVFTGDLYAHFPDAVTWVREAHNDFTIGVLPTLRGPHAGKHVDVFDPGRRYLSGVWRGMPSGELREHHAKRAFVPAEREDRPATDLLGDAQALRQRLTRLWYVEVLGVGPDYKPVPAATVRRWLGGPGGPAFPAECAGAYDGGRRLDLGTPADREALLAEPWDDARLLDTAAGLYTRAADRATAWRKARATLDRLLVQTAYAPDGRHRALADDLEEELRKSGRWLAALDRWVYVVHVHMAARLADLGVHDELLGRYESVLRFQVLAADAREYRNRVAAFVRRLAGHGGSLRGAVRDAGREFKASASDLAAYRAEARAIDDPFLKAWTGDVPLDEFLYSHDRPPGRGGLDLEDLGRRLLAAWEEVTAKARWLHRSTLAELLALQERIRIEFRQLAGAAASEPTGPIELAPLDEADGDHLKFADRIRPPE